MALRTTALLLSFTTALLASANANATPLQVNLTFTVTASSGPGPRPGPVNDPYGLSGSSWTLSYVIDNPVYSSVTSPWGTHSGLVSSSASLTISGAGNADLNGIFAISDSVSHNFLLVPRYSASGSYGLFGLNSDASYGSFSFGTQDFNVQNLLINSTSPAQVPPIGSSASEDDFNSLTINAGQFIINSVSLGNVQYTINAGGAISTGDVIPEPSTYALTIAALMLGAILLRRRKSC